MVGRHAESKLRWVSSVNAPLPFASLCFDYAPARAPPRLGPAASSPRGANALALAATAGTLCRRVRRLSPEQGRGERATSAHLPFVAPTANLPRVSNWLVPEPVLL